MASPTDTRGSQMDTLKIVFAIGLLGIGVVGFYMYSDESLLYRVLGLVALAGIAVGVIYTTAPGQRTWRFAQDARVELRKVVWPTRTEATQTTLIVIAVVILIGIFLWILDTIFQWAFGAITGIGS
jgi:preprotein translocase subunit SecE